MKTNANLQTANCKRHTGVVGLRADSVVWRLAFGVWRSAFPSARAWRPSR